MSRKKKIILLGATGSIGDSTLSLLREKKHEFELLGVSTNSNVKKLSNIVNEFNVKNIAINDKAASNGFVGKSNIFSGLQGLNHLASLDCDIVVSGISGVNGLMPALNALRSGNNLAIANKEPLVVAGKFFIQEAKKNNVKLLPVDSEHSSIFQCLNEQHIDNLSYITLTASGGPFLNYEKKNFKDIKPKDAVKHPNWTMGKKISVDSSTLINKALEIVEAGILFNLKSDQIKVVIHPESIVHGLVHYNDGTVLANLSWPNMVTPLAVALAYPNRINLDLKPLDLIKISNLTFKRPDLCKFPGLSFGWKSLDAGGCYPIVLNAANEIAVEMFLNKTISFDKIIDIIDYSLFKINLKSPTCVEDTLEIDKITRLEVLSYVKGL